MSTMTFLLLIYTIYNSVTHHNAKSVVNVNAGRTNRNFIISVVHTVYGHEGEALKFEQDSEYCRCGGGESEKDLVDDEAHHGVQTNGEGAGNANGVNVFEHFPVGQHF